MIGITETQRLVNLRYSLDHNEKDAFHSRVAGVVVPGALICRPCGRSAGNPLQRINTPALRRPLHRLKFYSQRRPFADQRRMECAMLSIACYILR